MTSPRFNTALIVGAGSGLSASLARALADEGIKVALAARSTDDLAAAGEGDRRARPSPATRASAPSGKAVRRSRCWHSARRRS